MLKKILVLMSLFTIVMIAIPTIEDGYRASKNTVEGDRLRLFKYYTAARYYGVPYALEHYGIKHKHGL